MRFAGGSVISAIAVASLLAACSQAEASMITYDYIGQEFAIFGGDAPSADKKAQDRITASITLQGISSDFTRTLSYTQNASYINQVIISNGVNASTLDNYDHFLLTLKNESVTDFFLAANHVDADASPTISPFSILALYTFGGTLAPSDGAYISDDLDAIATEVEKWVEISLIPLPSAGLLFVSGLASLVVFGATRRR